MATTLTRLTALTAASTIALAGCTAEGRGNDRDNVPDAASTPHAASPLREALTGEQFYFVMADRFADGDSSNNTGGYEDDPMVSGYDPTNAGFYQGGDLAGIMDRLDYIEGLGTTAIWLTPSFTNKPVQVEDDSAGYHGYWVTDFTSIDPHLGTNEEFAQLVDAAHDRGMKVFLDIITNHTADVIGYEEGERVAYVSKDDAPYVDAEGNEFDDRAVAGTDAFPELDTASSFPYTPVLEPGEEDAKTPSWLNDLTMYHHRGDTTFAGEDSQYGDFYGLDDLFTENPAVVDGMVDIYSAWIEDFGVDGFRIDTMKHVDDAFWQRFGPEVLEAAHEAGKDEFMMFGEVYDTSRAVTSHYTTAASMQSVLDFSFQEAARQYVSQSGSATALADFFAADDWYTDADSNAYQLPTFLGNHDMGRFGSFLEDDNPEASDDELLQRDILAHSLMLLSRGNPVVYYGDEQGFTGDGGDKEARQTMFASQVDSYLEDDLIGTDATVATDSYDTTHPLYEAIADLSALVDKHPALRDGVHQNRFASDGAGVYAFSRMDRDDQREYVVAVNNSTEPVTAEIPTWASKRQYKAIYGATGAERTDRDAVLTVTVPALSAVVYESAGRVSPATGTPNVTITTAEPASEDLGRMHVAASVAGDQYAEVTFWSRTGDDDWQLLGTDDSVPYQVFDLVTDLDAGTAVEYRAVAANAKGRSSTSDSATGVVAAPQVTLTSPTSGTTLGEDPVLSATVRPERAGTSVTFERRLAGEEWEEVATDTSAPAWSTRDDVSGLEDGTEVQYRAVATSAGTTVTSSIIPALTGAAAQPGAVSVPGSFNVAVGCASDWQPDCEAIQMTLDEDQSLWNLTLDLPAGSHQFKIAIDGSWTENYGDGGAMDGANIALELEEASAVTFTYDHATHLVEVTGGSVGGGTGGDSPESVTLAGSLQIPLGCDADWDPTCAATSMTHEGDGVWSLSGSLAAGSYEYKVVYDGSWSVNYGADGVLDGGNISLELAADADVTFRYDESTHLVQVEGT